MDTYYSHHLTIRKHFSTLDRVLAARGEGEERLSDALKRKVAERNGEVWLGDW